MIGLDSNYYAELANDSESYSAMRHREAEEARKGHEEWERVRVSLLADSEEFKGRLNERICDEQEWASNLENFLADDKHVMDMYKAGMLSWGNNYEIEQEAKTLASIIVGDDYE
jgi:hypothetical protein